MAKRTETQERLATLQAARAETLTEIAALDAQLADLEAKRQEIEAEATDPLSRRGVGASVADLGEVINAAASLGRVRKALSQRQGAVDREIEGVMAELHRAETHKGHLKERAHFERDLLPKLRAALASLEQLEQIQAEIRTNFGSPRAVVRNEFGMWLKSVIEVGEAGTPFAQWADWTDAA